MTVQELKVCFSLIPRYWLTNQKPLSLTWEKILAPEAMAITMQARCMGPNSIWTNKGETSPAAVIMATVEEPCRIRTMAALAKAKNRIGITASDKEMAKSYPAPVSVSICLKTPPAPVSRMMVPAGARDLVEISSSCVLENPLLSPKKYQASKLAIIRAVK